MLWRLKKQARAFRDELNLYRKVLGDERTPWLARVLLGLAVGYVLLPFDLVPDFIPVMGVLDDLIIVPVLVIGALKLIPPELMEEHRSTRETDGV